MLYIAAGASNKRIHQKSINMRNTVTEALIYENQGLINEAMQIDKNILQSDPNNIQAQNNLRRLSGRVGSANAAMLELFLRLKSEDEIREFKRWLIKL